MKRADILLRWLLSIAALSGVAFLSAGRTNLPMLRAYLGIFAASGLAEALIVDPALLQERGNPGPGVLDPFVGCGTSFLFVLTVVLAALDSGRIHWSQPIAQPLQVAALLSLLAVTALQNWAMAVNPFFSSAIRLQTERAHYLITSGPYRFLRHPGYFAMLVNMPATAIVLGSVPALVPALLYSAMILRRTIQEDHFLRERLPGYPGYMFRVRYRLIPGLW